MILMEFKKLAVVYCQVLKTLVTNSCSFFKQDMKSYPVWCRHNLYDVKRRAKRTIFFLRRKYPHFVGKEKSLKKSSITSMVPLIKLYNSYTFHQTITKSHFKLIKMSLYNVFPSQLSIKFSGPRAEKSILLHINQIGMRHGK